MFHATGLPGWMRFGWRGATSGYQDQDPHPDPTAELQALRNQAATLQAQLADVQRRLGTLETESTKG